MVARTEESPAPTPCAAVVCVEASGDAWTVTLGGCWELTAVPPPSAPFGRRDRPARVRVVVASDLGEWDSSLLLYVHELRCWAERTGAAWDDSSLPAEMRGLAARFDRACEEVRPEERAQNLLAAVGLAAHEVWEAARQIALFVGQCVLSAVYLARHPRKFRLRDCFEQMQVCGAMSLPIVSLIGLLVGLILAYQAAVLMRQFGADIYVADAVGLAMVREMGAMMTAVIIAGRIGAAYAATLGNMRANDEIDALQTLGIEPVDFLVAPRLVALALMVPLLTLYSNCMGILGGMAVSRLVLDIPPAAYWLQTVSAIDLSDVASGLIKSVAFGLLVGLSGCHRGLLAERSAAGVGRAATSAVVMALLLIIFADAFFAVAFNLFGI